MNLLQATAIATLLAAIPLLAQSQEHQHATPQPAQPRLSSPGMTMSPGMMQGMMGSGGMMTQGMIGQGSPGLGSGGRQRWSGFGNMPIDRVEGRLAFLKTELRISDAQLPAWNAFAEAVRTNATTQHAERQFMHGRVGTDVPLPDRVAAQANAFAAHAEEMAKLKAVLDPLYASLSAEQKKTADEIVFSPMGVPIGPM